MKDREQVVSTFMGNGLAIYGTDEAKTNVIHSGLTLLQILKALTGMASS